MMVERKGQRRVWSPSDGWQSGIEDGERKRLLLKAWSNASGRMDGRC
jgi:hypothetical protein